MRVLAPLSGVVVPLEAVPDPVFARKMVGDGVAIDPTSTEVLAPVSGTVSQLHGAHHALAVTTDDGVEILVHVGLDTVSLAGRGFTPLVARGDRVKVGQPLLRFDPDVVARGARSLLTAVLSTGGGRVTRLAGGFVEAGKSVLLEAEPGRSEAAADGATAEKASSAPVAVPNPAGLHARPAAILATAAKKFESRILLVRGVDEANAKSVVGVMGLSTKQGDTVRVEAFGPDAARAVAELAELIVAGCGEPGGEARQEATALAKPPLRVAAVEGEIVGVPASPGLAIGQVFHHRTAEIKVHETGGTPQEERNRFAVAVREAARQLEVLKQHAPEPTRAQILGVHLAFLDDPDLVAPAEASLAAGKSAAFAWRGAFESHAEKLERLESALLRERAADVRDVGARVLALLAGVERADVAAPEGSVVVAEELTPSDMASLDRTRIAAIVTTTGSSTSHVAILARARGIPAVCGVDEAALALGDGVRVVVDGTRGVVRIDPDERDLERARVRMTRLAAQAEVDRAAAFTEGRTRDGHRVEVVANVRNVEEARDALEAGAEGVGLLRSEFLFLGDRTEPPSEDEQAAAYRAVAEALGRDRRFIIRTLDVGGDKPLAYLPRPKEANPFLGVRGIRFSLAYPELFRIQLRAILRAASAGNIHVMFPMIATLDELRAAKQFLAEAQREVAHAVKVGIMIEVPSAAIISEVLAREVDFFSIGTNDLTQYTLAMDRGNAQVAKDADALHPSVLRMIALTIEGAHEHGKWVGVCGGIASDPLAVPVLVGLGVDELSVSVPAIPSVKAALARWTFGDCAELASDVLRLRTTQEVRKFLADVAEQPETSRAERVLP